MFNHFIGGGPVPVTDHPDCRTRVNELQCLYRALSLFGLLHCMAFAISDGKKKHIKSSTNKNWLHFILF